MGGKKKWDFSDTQIKDALDECRGNKVAAAKKLRIPAGTYRGRLDKIGYKYEDPRDASPKWRSIKKRDHWVIESNDPRINTVDDAIAKADVDLVIWEVDKFEISAWDVTMKLKKGGEEKPFRSQNQRIKVTLKRKIKEEIVDAVEGLLERLRKKSPIVVKYKRGNKSVRRKNKRHSLEICLMDPHYGMRCFTPGSDANWSPELCHSMIMDTLDEVLNLAGNHAPFEEIVFPLGNDFFHTDTIWNTTTAGTGQPEADAYYHTFVGGEIMAIAIIDKLKKVAPVKVYSIPGNHDRTTSFMLGRIMNAYYHNDKNVMVAADESPYKFHEYGCNLIGYEHGHSITPIRLAALMANECPEAWARTKGGYREWHIGDQHRKASSKPSVFEEQGVSVEFLPGLTPPNEWHRLKSFSHQQRGTMAFVWDYYAGPIARLQVNIDRYMNKLMGR